MLKWLRRKKDKGLDQAEARIQQALAEEWIRPALRDRAVALDLSNLGLESLPSSLKQLTQPAKT